MITVVTVVTANNPLACEMVDNIAFAPSGGPDVFARGASPAPEPATVALFGLAAFGLAATRRH